AAAATGSIAQPDRVTVSSVRIMIFVPLVAGGVLVGKPYGDRVNIGIAHTAGDGTHQILGIVFAGAFLPGLQLCLDVTGVLAGNAGKYVARTLVAGAVAALAGNNVLGPVATLG